MDANVKANYEVPLWNETRWNGCWNAEEGVGLYLHLGRYRYDLDMWWAQVVAYLPDTELCVQRVWGRNPSEKGVDFAGFELEMTENGWQASFDGVGDLTTTDALARAPKGSGSPVRSMRFEVTAENHQPEWDMYAEVSEKEDFAGDAHVQGSFKTEGTLSVGDDSYRLDGIGFKDHSSGPRDFAKWFGHRFFVIVGDGYSCHAVVMYTPDGEPMAPRGAFFRDGEQSAIERFELPLLESSAGDPVRGDVLIETSSGEVLEFESELVHALPMTMTMDNDYINGVDWELEPDPIALVEGKGRLTAPDGTVAYCFHERSALRSMVTLPGGVATAGAQA